MTAFPSLQDVVIHIEPPPQPGRADGRDQA
jgi:hypothetical protein